MDMFHKEKGVFKRKEFLRKKSSYDKFYGKWDIHCADDIVMCLDNLTVQIGRHIDGFNRLMEGMV